MRNRFRRISPFDNLYAEAQLPKPVRRGLNWILGGNLFGTLHGIVCGGGTAALVGLAGMLGAGDMEFGLLDALERHFVRLFIFLFFDDAHMTSPSACPILS